jgi:hypothetical protein
VTYSAVNSASATARPDKEKPPDQHAAGLLPRRHGAGSPAADPVAWPQRGVGSGPSAGAARDRRRRRRAHIRDGVSGVFASGRLLPLICSIQLGLWHAYIRAAAAAAAVAPSRLVGSRSKVRSAACCGSLTAVLGGACNLFGEMHLISCLVCVQCREPILHCGHAANEMRGIWNFFSIVI